MKLSITSDFPDVARQIAALEKSIVQQATARAVNRTMEQARTAMSREIRSEFRMSAAQVNESLRITRASFHRGSLNLEASLESKTKRGRSLNLVHFLEKSVTLAQARKRIKAGEGGTHRLRNGGTVRKAMELRFQIKRQGGKKVIRGAFIGNKGRTVFVREGETRLPIQPVQAIGVPQMFNTKRVNDKVVQMMRDKFPQIFAHEAKFYTDRFNNRRASK